MKTINKKCENCIWFRLSELGKMNVRIDFNGKKNKDGFCVRYAPNPHFASVNKDDFCGEFSEA